LSATEGKMPTSLSTTGAEQSDPVVAIVIALVIVTAVLAIGTFYWLKKKKSLKY
jgi:LPXTG-motif cell wall-anchored protein